MKDWSLGKLLGLMVGMFVLLAVIAMIVANVIKHHRAAGSGSLMGLSSPGNAAPAALAAPRPHDGLLDDQLRQLSDKLDELQQQTDKMSADTRQNNQSIMTNFTTIQNEVKSLSDRVNALEHPNTGPVQVVKTPEKPRVSAVKRLARRAKELPRRAGYQTEAIVGNRAWIRAGGVETTRAVGEALPRVAPRERIEAVDADSGVYVVPAH